MKGGSKNIYRKTKSNVLLSIAELFQPGTSAMTSWAASIKQVTTTDPQVGDPQAVAPGTEYQAQLIFKGEKVQPRLFWVEFVWGKTSLLQWRHQLKAQFCPQVALRTLMSRIEDSVRLVRVRVWPYCFLALNLLAPLPKLHCVYTGCHYFTINT